MTQIQSKLFDLQELSYQRFQCRLMPTVDPDTVIGVRTPALRALAKELWEKPEAAQFLRELPHQYYEENNLHGFLLERIRDFGTCVAEVDRFLTYVDNWATCDLISPKVFAKHLPELLAKIREWMGSSQPYTIRFGMEQLMRYYLDEAFQPAYLEMVAQIESDDYYVKMMAAWFFATALVKQYEAALPYLTERRLSPWIHNKAIQKAVESRRITQEQKLYLKTLKV